MWCEHCRDNYDEEHYGEDSHFVGIEFGPTGKQMLLEREIQRFVDWYDDLPNYKDDPFLINMRLEPIRKILND